MSADFLRTLGKPPSLGREFTADETRAGGPQAVVISDSLWRSTFGADPRVLGRSVNETVARRWWPGSSPSATASGSAASRARTS